MPVTKLRFLPAVAVASALALTSCDRQENVLPAQLTENPASGERNSRYVVVLRPEAAGADLQEPAGALAARYGLGKTSQLLNGKLLNGFSTALTEKQVAALRADKRVALIEPDQKLITPDHNSPDHSTARLLGDQMALVSSMPPPQPFTHVITPNPAQNLSWGTARVGVGNGTVSGRTAWIVDSGIQLNHPDLNVDVARSRSFLSTTTSPDDQFGHGTMVAGLLGAKNNEIGVVGIAAGAPLVAVRVMDATGNGSVSTVLAALNYVAQNAQPGDVACLSFGAAPSVSLDNAVIALANLGVHVVVAAGNSNANAANYSPARVNHQNVYTVSGLRADGTFMGISNWGTPVDYCAPGTGLQTTKINGAYGSAGGTSMAVPHVAGILLVRGNIITDGYVQDDPDGTADPIPHL